MTFFRVCCFYKRSVDLVFDMLKHLSIRSEYCIYMFQNIDKIPEQLDRTNELLEKIESHLKDLTMPPDLIDWANKLKVKRKNF